MLIFMWLRGLRWKLLILHDSLPLLNYKGTWHSPEPSVSSNVWDNSHPNQFPFLNLQPVISFSFKASPFILRLFYTNVEWQ